MTRSDLVNRLCQLYPETDHRLVEDAVSLFFFEIVSTLQRNDRVELRGLGSFCLRKREKRMGRNPKTGEPVPVDEKWVPFFKAGKELKAVINQQKANSNRASSS
jgi:integration host factor subunit beta